MANPFANLAKYFRKPTQIPAKAVTNQVSLSDKEKLILRNLGIYIQDLQNLINQHTMINFERNHIYREIDRALINPIIASATELYADYATNYDRIQNGSVWVTSDSDVYVNKLTELFDDLGIEEKIFDWAWQVSAFGDLFIKVNAVPGVGIVSIVDDDHPLNISRVDKDGVLIGFYRTPMGMAATESRELMPPWEYVHCRLLGAKKKRPLYCLEGNTEIKLLDGTSPKIAEMAENREKYIGKSIFSVNPNTRELELDEIVDVQKTRPNAQLVRVHLDNELFVDVTPDHLFMMRDGTYKEARFLQPGDSLMPYYEMLPTKGDLPEYLMVHNPGDDKWHFVHRLVVKLKGEVVKRGQIIHHKDFNRKNNEPDNLPVLLRDLHASIHSKTCFANPEWIQRKQQNPEYRAKMLAHLEKARQAPHKPSSQYAPHPEDCKCVVCRTKRNDRPMHQLGCKCWACNAKEFWTGRLKSESQIQHMRKPKSLEHRLNISKGRKRMFAEKKVELVLNHKVVQVEWLLERKDTYDITTKRNHNFPLKVGIFVHNSDPSFAEYKSITLLSPDVRRLTSKYGTSLLLNAIPVYKRMRLAEDSLLLARLSKGVMRYIFKVSVDSSNIEAVSEIIEDYKVLLKRTRAIDTTNSNPNFIDNFEMMDVLTDLVIPVWGDVNNLAVEKLGGETDIRWIADIKELRNQLASALRVPLQLLGGYVDEGGGMNLGRSAIERLDIRFARSARRVQRALIEGIKRLAQIHLAYQGMAADFSMFEVNMSDTSTAEEEEIKDALDKGVDIVDKIVDVVNKALGEGNVNTYELLDYLNQKFLKLNDLDLLKLIKNKDSEIAKAIESKLNESAEKQKKIIKRPYRTNNDIDAHTVLDESKWREVYGKAKVKEEPIDESNGTVANEKTK